MNALTQQLAKELANALRFIEVQQAYRGCMTPAEVEAAIVSQRNVSRVEIAANSVTTLAVFNIDWARQLIAAAEKAFPCCGE
jgi:hypothetical protein